MEGISNPVPLEYKYSPVGRCIYCGKTAAEAVLTDEHVIPLSLGGTVKLPKSSCRDCAKITSNIERQVAKAMWDYTRVQHGLPSRRRKERPQHFELAMPDNSFQQIPIRDLPPLIISIKFPPAEILLGVPPSDKHVMADLRVDNITADAKKFFRI